MCFEPTDSFSRDGYLCLSDESGSLLTAIDRTIVQRAGSERCQHYVAPSIISGAVLAKCGYFESHPHHLHVVGQISAEGRAAVTRGEKLTGPMLEHHDLFLTPAACLHIYPTLATKDIGDGIVITSNVRVFRAEDGNYRPLIRQRDFTVREFVLVGSKDFVVGQLEAFRGLALDLARSVNPGATLEAASDHFYATKVNAIKEKIQLRNALKHELRIQIDDQPVAVASFNFHHHHFSRAFGFDRGGAVVTGCVGFGLERWIAATMASPGSASVFTN